MKALVLSGGGSKGAFQLGAIKRLMLVENNSYDIFCGTSVGALNASFLSQYTDKERLDGLSQLLDVWTTLKQSDVYSSWPILGMAIGFFKKGLYNASALRKFIRKHVSVDLLRSGKKLRVATVNLNTGGLRVFTEADNNILDGIYASAAYPVMFEPFEIEGEWYTDGGLRDLSPLKQAIDAGATEIHIVNCEGEYLGEQSINSARSLDILTRSASIMTNEILLNDLNVLHEINGQVVAGQNTEKRYIKFKLISPLPDTPLADPLKFNKKEIVKMIEAGYNDSQYYQSEVHNSF